MKFHCKKPFNRLGVALLSGAALFSTCSLPSSYRKVFSEDEKIERAEGSLELSSAERSDLKSVVKTLAELGHKDLALEVHAILVRADIQGKFKKENDALIVAIDKAVSKIRSISVLAKKAKTNGLIRKLNSFSKSLFESVVDKSLDQQIEALKILAVINPKSDEYISLASSIKDKGAWKPEYNLDISSVPASFKRISELNLGTSISSGVENGVGFATYKDNSGDVLKLESSAPGVADLELLMHESVRAITFFNGITTQEWQAPTVSTLLLAMLDAKEASSLPKGTNTETPGLLLSTSTGSQTPTRFFTIDEYNRHSTKLQANMLITALLRKLIENRQFANLPEFMGTGLVDLSCREITQVNAGADEELRKTLVGNLNRYIDTVGFRTLLFSTQTKYINHEDIKAINSEDLSLSKFLEGKASAKEGLGRLAAVRYIQYLFENKYLEGFIARITSEQAGFSDYSRILSEIAGRSIAELEADFKEWVKGIEKRGQATPEATVGDKGLFQVLEGLEGDNKLVVIKPVLEDVTLQAREAISFIREARAKFFGVDLPLAVSPLLCEANRLHTYYSEKHNGGTYGHIQDRTSKFYTVLGELGGRRSTLIDAPYSVTHQARIDLGVAYHSLPYFKISVELIGGYSNLRNSSSILAYNTRQSDIYVDREVLFWPYDGMREVPVRFGLGEAGEDPDPVPGNKGCPVKIIFRNDIPGDVKVKFYKLGKSGEKDLINDVVVLTPYNDPYHLLKKEVIAVPFGKQNDSNYQGLDYDTTYEIEVTGTGIDTHTSKFTTESKPK